MHEKRFTVPYVLPSGDRLSARVWAYDAAEAIYRAEVCIARAGLPNAVSFGEPFVEPEF